MLTIIFYVIIGYSIAKFNVFKYVIFGRRMTNTLRLCSLCDDCFHTDDICMKCKLCSSCCPDGAIEVECE